MLRVHVSVGRTLNRMCMCACVYVCAIVCICDCVCAKSLCPSCMCMPVDEISHLSHHWCECCVHAYMRLDACAPACVLEMCICALTMRAVELFSLVIGSGIIVLC